FAAQVADSLVSSAAQTRVLILSRSQLRLGVLEYIRDYSGTVRSGEHAARILIFADEGNGYSLVDDFSQAVGPRHPDVFPFNPTGGPSLAPAPPAPSSAPASVDPHASTAQP